jgi:hypothetical protein
MLCRDGSVTLAVQAPYTTVQWYRNDVILVQANTTTLTATEPGTYYVIAYTADCPSSPTVSSSITIQLDPNCDPTFPVIETNLTACPDTQVSAVLLNDVAYESYQWYVQAIEETSFFPIAGATTAAFDYNSTQYSGSKIKIAVVLNGITYESNVLEPSTINWVGLTVQRMHESDVTFDMNTGIFYMCEGAVVNCAIGMPFTIVQWYKDGIEIPGETATTYVITTPGEYHVVAAPSFCPDNFVVSDITKAVLDPDCGIAGIENPTFDKAILLYPNPATDVVNIQVAAGITAQSYSIVDSIGKTLLTGEINGTATTVATGFLSAGIYIVKVTGTDGQAVKRFIKQ